MQQVSNEEDAQQKTIIKLNRINNQGQEGAADNDKEFSNDLGETERFETSYPSVANTGEPSVRVTKRNTTDNSFKLQQLRSEDTHLPGAEHEAHLDSFDYQSLVYHSDMLRA